jgi:hypothetical protein
MKQINLIFLLILIHSTVFGQNKNTWNAFWNKDSSLLGFKDRSGIVKIEPKFTCFTLAQKFDHIIAVMEVIDRNHRSYYLTKTLKSFGEDSVHIFDNGADCESEGFIRFQDYKKDKVGVFNRYGKIAIPAVYNELSQVRNGLTIARIGAEKKYFGNDTISTYFSWEGGKELLLDTNNNIIIDNFKFNMNLNLFSIKKSILPNPDSTRQNFIGTDGQYYSFVDFEKEFKSWLKDSLLNNFSKVNLLLTSCEKIFYSKEPDSRTSESKTSFFNKNFQLVKSKLLQLNSANCNYSICNEGLNPFIYNPKEYSNYFNNCGESKDWLYPVKDVVISYDGKNGVIQDHFEFLRTDNGYKLIEVTIGNVE